jgi:hypothetical protein
MMRRLLAILLLLIAGCATSLPRDASPQSKDSSVVRAGTPVRDSDIHAEIADTDRFLRSGSLWRELAKAPIRAVVAPFILIPGTIAAAFGKEFPSGRLAAWMKRHGLWDDGGTQGR